MCILKATYYEFGTTVRHLREQKGLTQSDFIDEMNRASGRILQKDGKSYKKNGKKIKSIIHRSTLSGIENGDEKKIDSMTFEQLKTMSLVLGRWIGALLGEYTCKTYDHQFINSCTGLTDESIESLLHEKECISNEKYNEFIYMLNEIICANSSFESENSLFSYMMECCYKKYGVRVSQNMEMNNCDMNMDAELHSKTIASQNLYNLQVYETLEVFRHTLDATAEKTSNYLIEHMGL